MSDRTEELGLAARLPIQVGGETVELRTLNLDESEKWLARFGELDDQADMPTNAMLTLVVAYDLEKKLGTSASLRKRFTQVELKVALEGMVTAENPFGMEARSLVKESGANVPRTSPLMYHMIVRSLRASSTSLPLPNGDSTQQVSEGNSPRKGSSSSGPTASSA